MHSYRQLLYHIVFGTKLREPALVGPKRRELFKFMWGFVKNKRCHLYRLNGGEDHVHVLTSIHPSIAVADFIKGLKWSSSVWIKERGILPDFGAWQTGYAAFTHSFKEKDRLVRYIKNQEAHHREETFDVELERLLQDAGIDLNIRQ